MSDAYGFFLRDGFAGWAVVELATGETKGTIAVSGRLVGGVAAGGDRHCVLSVVDEGLRCATYALPEGRGAFCVRHTLERRDLRAWSATWTRDGGALLLEDDGSPRVRLSRFDGAEFVEQRVAAFEKPSADARAIPRRRRSTREAWVFVDMERGAYGARDGYVTAM